MRVSQVLKQRFEISAVLLGLLDADSMFILQGISPERFEILPHLDLFASPSRVDQVDNVDELLLQIPFAFCGRVARRDVDLQTQVLIAL